MLAEGDDVPDFSLKDAAGKLVKKSDLKGKIFRVFEKVKPAGHAQEVLEAFKN